MALATAHPKVNFARLVSATSQTPAEMRAAESHRGTIRTRLSQSFNVVNIIPIGSFSRDTAIENHSDVDLLAVLRRNEAKWGGSIVSSSTVLQRIRNDLNDRFVRTNVRRDGQAAVVSFASGSVDVVPALFVRMHETSPVYAIPNGAGGWLETSPDAHRNWIRRAQIRSQGKLQRVTRLLKYWKYCRENTLTIRSFYLEVWLALSGVCTGAKSYSEMLFDGFRMLHQNSLRSVVDPTGISGRIAPGVTAAQIEGIRTTIANCVEHAASALRAEGRGNFPEANRQWGIVFNGGF